MGFPLKQSGGAPTCFSPATPVIYPLIAVTNVIQSFLTSGLVGQIITVGLVIFSFIAWSIMIDKHMELKRLRMLNLSFEQRLRAERTLRRSR